MRRFLPLLPLCALVACQGDPTGKLEKKAPVEMPTAAQQALPEAPSVLTGPCPRPRRS